MNKFIMNLKNNWGMKLFSLIIALVLWFAINNMTTTTQEYYVNLQVESPQLPSNYEVVSSNISDVKVRVWGNREIIQKEITDASFQAKVQYLTEEKRMMCFLILI